MTQGDLRTPVVVDALVVLKWELDDEEHIAEAVALRDDFLIAGKTQLYAPHLYAYEIANSVTSATRRGRITSEQGHIILQRLFQTEIALRHPAMDRVYALALQFGLSTYDSSYITLSEALEAPFWTGDRQMFEAVRATLP